VLPGRYAALWRLKRLLPGLFVSLLSGARVRAALRIQPGGGSTERT